MNKKNLNVNENTMVEPVVVDQVVMDEETMKAIIEDNITIVPRNKRGEFASLTLEQKVKKIEFYQDMQKMKEEARIKYSVPNRVKELFTKRHATVEDAKAVLQFCNEFIDNFKVREIEKIDAEIAKLEELKLQFA